MVVKEEKEKFGKIKILDSNEVWKLLEEKLDNNWVIILGAAGMDVIEDKVYKPGTSKNEYFILIFVATGNLSSPIYPIGIGKKTKELKKFIGEASGEIITQQELDTLVSINIKGKVQHSNNKQCIVVELLGYNQNIPNTSFKNQCKKYINHIKKCVESGNIIPYPPEKLIELYDKIQKKKV